jgi:tyrosyl-tRNA synthetase
LEKFLRFGSDANAAEMVNNYDWFKDFSFLDFIRDVGKHISINYMLSKDSVKSRLETGLSFTEFSYQLVQGYDFYYLNEHKNCILQLGGSDQWGNIVTGTELIRRKSGKEAYAVTTPLITKADGTKFGKTEGGSVWLDPLKTTPYQFYQFWLNASDLDAVNYIRIFTLKSKSEIDEIIVLHEAAPHLRLLQKELAEDITVRVHGKENLENAINASNILFGKSTSADLMGLNEQDFLSIFEGVPQVTILSSDLNNGLTIVDALSSKSGFLSSNGEARRELKANAISVNKEKVNEEFVLTNKDLIQGKFILLGKGKKTNYILKISN